MANLGLTVNQLKKFVDEQVKLGNGDKHVLISEDDEGNGYHTLFYAFSTKENVGEEDFEAMVETEHDGTHTVDNCVILG